MDAAPPAKRGRPSKATSDKAEPAAKAPLAKKRGRPAKAAASAPAVPEEENAPPKKRGRPPKGGETTKVAADDGAAAEQLEEELVDAVVDEGAAETSKPTFPTRKRGRPAKGKQAAVAVTADAEAEDLEEINVAGLAVDASGKQYWLMKAEQEDREETLKDGGVVSSSSVIVLGTHADLTCSLFSSTRSSRSMIFARRAAPSRGMACTMQWHARTSAR